jgi:UDP-sugar transporter A1/2/3
VFLLGKQLSMMQWFSLSLLCIGVSLTQVSSMQPAAKLEHGNAVNGFIAVAVAAVLSGFAGVYFEKILKTSDVSLWMRNVQMALLGVPVGLIGVFYSPENTQVLEHGPFYGYTRMVVFVIIVQAIGGLLVAASVKYADNILKGFATSISMICSLLVSIALFSFQPTLYFLLGAVRASCYCHVPVLIDYAIIVKSVFLFLN